jgi:hypothetical protein
VRRFDPRPNIDLDRQVTAPGATWLDYRLVERQRMPLAMSGSDRKCAMPWKHAPSISRRMYSPVARGRASSRSATSSPRCGAENSTPPAPGCRPRPRCPTRRAAGGEIVAGTFRRRLTLSFGRLAMIDNGLGFALVPWTPVLDRYLGRHVAGVAKESGGIKLVFRT